jgi:hypothetical protein
MSAPAAKARSLPVMTMAPIAGVGVERLQLGFQLAHQRVAEGVQRLRAVEADQPDAAVGFDEDVWFVGHGLVSRRVGLVIDQAEARRNGEGTGFSVIAGPTTSSASGHPFIITGPAPSSSPGSTR